MKKTKSVREPEGYYKFTDYDFKREDVELYSFIRKFLKSFSPPLRVFDIGCGLGHLADFVGATGFDINRFAIKRAAIHFPGTRFVCCDITRLDLRKLRIKKAGAVICSNVIEHLDDPSRVRLLRDVIPKILGGKGIMIFALQRTYFLPNMINMLLRRGRIFEPTHVHNWTEKEFVDEIGKYFRIERTVRLSGFTRFTGLTRHLKNETVVVARMKKIT